MVRQRTIQTSVETGFHDGLAYALWMPDDGASGAVVILHGADSCKESHYDFGRAARAAGLAAIAFDQRGHGESDGPLGDRMLDDVDAIAALLMQRIGGAQRPRLALRGSSMGGYLAVLAAVRLRADAVVAICPAGAEHLLRGLRSGRFEFDLDVAALEAFLAAHDVIRAAGELRAPLLLMHAEGDEQIPIEHSREIDRAAAAPGGRMLALPGGHHRSVQHDPELQGESLRFIGRVFGERPPAADG